MNLNYDELTIICEFLNLTAPKTNLNLSLVNRKFYSITSSDEYWKKIIERYNVMDESIRIEEIGQVDIKKSFVKFRKMQCFNNDPYPNAPQRLALSSFIMFMFLFLLSLCLVVPGVISLTSQLECERKIVSVDRLTLNDTIPNRIKYRYTLELSIKDNSIRYNSISIYECFEGECEINKFENFTTFCTYDPRKKGPRLDTQADFIGLFAAAGICLVISFEDFIHSFTLLALLSNDKFAFIDYSPCIEFQWTRYD